MTFAAPNRPVSRVFVHCSDSDIPAHDNVETIRRWHTTPDKNDPSKPWRDVGYHFIITKDGSLCRGRNLEIAPSAQAGHNAGTIAVCLTGRTEFTEEQFETLRSFCAAVHEQLPLVTFHGHKEVSPGKTCPAFNYREVLGLNAKGQLT